MPGLAEILSALGGFIYLAQMWFYTHTQISNLDEGNYLYKGYLFATGQYWPYQDYGPRTNHMPLSFLIPGYVQKWFGPGLRTGRYLAWFLGLLLLVGVWFLFRRIGGRWWTAGVIFALALNPAGIKMNSMLTSQVQINCLVVWVLVLALGGKRPQWQVVLGAVLAGLALLTRLNLAPLLPLLLLYILWEHGWRTALSAALGSGLVVGVGHAIFWPGILRMWASWLPEGLTPFLNEFRAPGGKLLWDPGSDLFNTLLSLFTGIRFQFTAFVGYLFSILLFPRKKNWQNQADYRASVFVATLFTVLLAAHVWVTLNWTRGANSYYGSSYCVYCFPAYISFFAILGLVLVVISYSAWPVKVPVGVQTLLVGILLVLAAGVGFGAFESIGKPLVEAQIPRFSGGRFGPGTVTVWGLFNNKFGWTYPQSRRIVPAMAGFFLGSGLVLIAGILKTGKIARKLGIENQSFAQVSIGLLIFASIILAPSPILGGGSHVSDCNADVIRSYEDLGAALKRLRLAFILTIVAAITMWATVSDGPVLAMVGLAMAVFIFSLAGIPL